MIKTGTLVIIDFLDHCFTTNGRSAALECRLVGWVARDAKNTIEISPWIANCDIKDENNDTYTIVKHPGISIRRLYDKRR